MRRILFGIILLATTSQAEPLRWWKRIGAIAVCSAEAFDTATTFYQSAQLGRGHAYETSPMLRGPNGDPSPWKFALVKGGICAGAILMAHSKGTMGLVGLGLAPMMAVPPLIGGVKNMRLQPGVESKRR